MLKEGDAVKVRSEFTTNQGQRLDRFLVLRVAGSTATVSAWGKGKPIVIAVRKLVRVPKEELNITRITR
jgi:hypothetical protein